jgi:hypothetical protein
MACVIMYVGLQVVHVDDFASAQAALDAAVASAHTQRTALLFSSRQYRLAGSGVSGSSVLTVANVSHHGSHRARTLFYYVGVHSSHERELPLCCRSPACASTAAARPSW